MGLLLLLLTPLPHRTPTWRWDQSMRVASIVWEASSLVMEWMTLIRWPVCAVLVPASRSARLRILPCRGTKTIAGRRMVY